MIIDFMVADRTIEEPTIFYHNFPWGPNFQIASVGKDSYIGPSSISTGVYFTVNQGYGVHNLQIGNFVSVGDNVEFCLGINHNHQCLTTGVSNLFSQPQNRYRQKGQILIQNDVWIGRNVMIMSGVTIHNGAVVAANSHVVKDVPPYAIVGGNPARVIKYRFSQEIIDKLLKIQWWNWSNEKIKNNSEFFYSEDVDKFCNKFYDESRRNNIEIKELAVNRLEETFLFFTDFSDTYPIWQRVIKEFILKYKESYRHLLILYLNEGNSNNIDGEKNNINQYINEIRKNIDYKCVINTWQDSKENERSIFKSVDYYITNRGKETVLHSCYADESNVKIISGVDEPIFK